MKRFAILAASSLALVVIPTSALAQHAASTCTQDGTADELHVVDAPVSVSLEAGTTSGGTHLTVCYSDTPTGTASVVTGGYVQVRANPDTNEVSVSCVNDPGAVRVQCEDRLHEKAVGTNAVCVLSLNGACVVEVPAPYVLTGTAAGPTLTVTVFNTPTTVEYHTGCIGYCP